MPSMLNASMRRSGIGSQIFGFIISMCMVSGICRFGTCMYNQWLVRNNYIILGASGDLD